MMTFDSNLLTANARIRVESVEQVTLETDYQRAQITTQADWNWGAYGTADSASIPGSLILQQPGGDIESFSAFGATQFKIVETGGAITVFFSTSIAITFVSISFNAKANVTNATITWTLEKIGDIIPTANASVGATTIIATGNTIATPITPAAFADYSIIPNVAIQKGNYILTLNNTSTGALPGDCDVYIKSWQPNETINITGGKGRNFIYVKTGLISSFGTYYAPSVDYVGGTKPFFDGWTICKTFVTSGFASSTYTGNWIPVKDQGGSNVTPTVNGVAQFDIQLPNSCVMGTNLIIKLEGATSGAGAGAVTISTDLRDGDAVATLKPYYRFTLTTFTTATAFETPILQSLQIYFPTNTKKVKGVDLTNGYNPLLTRVFDQSYQYDPMEAKSNLGALQFDLSIQKKGTSKTISDVESLITAKYLTGSGITILQGYRNIPESSFAPYAQGTLDRFDSFYDRIAFYSTDTLKRSRDSYKIDQSIVINQKTFAYANPCDILIELLHLSGMGARFVNEASFASIKSSFFSSWQFFNYFKTPIDLKTELDTICKLLGVSVVQLEDGKVYCVKFNDSSKSITYTFDDNNSMPIDMVDLNQDKRINDCMIRRGFWDEYNLIENVNQYWDAVFSDTAIASVGRSARLTLDNKWIPKDILVGGTPQSVLVGQRITSDFGKGMPIIKRVTSKQYADVQLGDNVNVTTDQILYKSVSGSNTWRCAVIGKTYKESNSTIEWLLWAYQVL
jgi:hypothetical protein